MQEGVWLPHVTWSKERTHHVLRLRHWTRPKGIKRCRNTSVSTIVVVVSLWHERLRTNNPNVSLYVQNILYLVQARGMVRQCLGPLCAVWTGQMTAHWLAAVAPRTSPPGDPWRWLKQKQTGAEPRDG